MKIHFTTILTVALFSNGQSERKKGEARAVEVTSLINRASLDWTTTAQYMLIVRPVTRDISC